ncbi:hypothetical protein ACKRZS_009372 [Fusarium odoratissimum]|uniref:Chaperone protein DnaJ n=3 Tax=Fusarium oxysporum species complex TaxID=171631 RepID=N1RVK0_FUSC4|nr:uncharacterized protein FOIG_06544 [Fusarium odoratissimum NRRL 54006]EMT66265.1 Chaperone protein DnaJ [Fusarium odoratissimum]KAH7211724.1 hypothetical protein DER44DRAFT_742303 [Fusarium oxysporum]KAK2133715.1 hypothetical protein NOF04DRAFT_1041151 [Fusarium oxysporum II5]TXC07796.1 hypothetical protein FocTR4_00003936 [Fusarium oxysporum f. sp. cubense]EXM02274.1 hypothetical protein FOIG_06544 [Fusarium odoratissimum NRRL 54006]
MTTSTPDPYEILGVAKDAQLPEIRSAHRKLVLKCHPDKVQDPTLKAQKQDEFQRVQTAYELLADEKARKRYDDQARLAELREQMRAKAAASASSRPSASTTASPSSSRPTPTSTTYKYEIRTNDRTYKTDRQPSPVRGYSSYSRSYEDEHPRAADIFEGVRTVRREKSYQDKTTKREEREREKELERAREKEYARELREKERERERRRRADEAIRRAEKENKEAEKEARRAEKKSRDKSRKRDTEEKKRHTKPYIETYDGEPISSKSEKKKSSKKHDERRERDRSSHREEAPPTTSSMHPPPIPVEYQDKTNAALNYIQASRSKGSYASRHMVQPPAPTPPPVGSPFAAPADDDDARRSSAKPRRGSTGEKAYKPEVVDDPIEATPPTARPHMHKSATATGAPTTSPPRRTNTMPNEGYSRHVPGISRAQTFSGAYPEPDPRGRGRTRMQAQVPESDDEDDYERYRRERERKSHRSSKKHRSPESRGEHVMQYRVNDGRTTLQNSYSRATPTEEAYSYYANQPNVRIVERPSMPSRDAAYSASYGNYPGKVKTSSYGDVQFSEYPAYREAYAA